MHGFQTTDRLSSEDFHFGLLVALAAKHRPDGRFAQCDSAEDHVQKPVFGMDDSASLLPLLDANHAELASQASNSNWFVTAGKQHTFLTRPEFYTARAGEVVLRDWVATLLGPDAPANAHCGDACG